MARRKILVTLDDALVRRLDRAARERGVTRSALLATIAERDLQRRTPDQQREIDGALRALRKLAERHGTADEDSATIVRTMRDERTERLASR
jgi:metal-responsive CopG/Arc/MetJ family transcriptional regulator